jgi:hypothetical protein
MGAINNYLPYLLLVEQDAPHSRPSSHTVSPLITADDTSPSSRAVSSRLHHSSPTLPSFIRRKLSPIVSSSSSFHTHPSPFSSMCLCFSFLLEFPLDLLLSDLLFAHLPAMLSQHRPQRLNSLELGESLVSLLHCSTIGFVMKMSCPQRFKFPFKGSFLICRLLSLSRGEGTERKGMDGDAIRREDQGETHSRLFSPSLLSLFSSLSFL